MVLQEPYPACPLCDGPSQLLGVADCTSHALWHDALPRTIDWMRCDRCTHVHTRHYWTQAGLAEVFRNAHPIQQANPGVGPDAKRATWSPVVERVSRLLGGYGQAMNTSRPATWVDVGCGDGGLVMTAADFGFDAIGLDARAESVSRIRSLGGAAQQGDFMQVGFAAPPDVLSMMDVLEHMPYPARALARVAQLVRPGGVLVVSMPDMNCSSWRAMDAANVNPYWLEFEHHHNFSRKRLTALLQQSGFDVAGFAIPTRYKAQMELYAIPRARAG